MLKKNEHQFESFETDFHLCFFIIILGTNFFRKFIFFFFSEIFSNFFSSKIYDFTTQLNF